MTILDLIWLVRVRCPSCGYSKDYSTASAYPVTCPACTDGGVVYSDKEDK